MTIDSSIVLTARVMGVLVFGVAFLRKLRHTNEFIGIVVNYRLVPEVLAPPVSWLIVAVEAFVTLSLASGWLQIGGAVLAIALLSVFAAAMAINISRGRTVIDCGCFQSALRQKVSGPLIVRNLCLILLLLPLLAAAAQDLTLLQTVDGLAAGIVLFMLYEASGAIVALRDTAEALRKRFN